MRTPGSTRPRRKAPGRFAIAVMLVAALLALSGCTDKDKGASDTSGPVAADTQAPPNSAGKTHKIKLPDGRTVVVAAGITLSAVNAGLITIGIARGVPTVEVLMAVGKINLQGVRYVWQTASSAVTFIYRQGALVRQSIVRAGKTIVRLKPLILPLAVLWLIYEEDKNERAVVSDFGRLNRVFNDPGDTCTLTFFPTDDKAYSRTLMEDEKACQTPRDSGLSETTNPTAYISYEGGGSRKPVDLVFQRLRTLKDYSGEKISLPTGGTKVPGRKCTITFSGGGKLRLESTIVDGRGKSARVSDPCAAYRNVSPGTEVYAGDKIVGVRVGKSVPKTELMNRATVFGILQATGSGEGCTLILTPAVDNGLRGVSKRRDGSYRLPVKAGSDAVPLCNVGRSRVWARSRWSGVELTVPPLNEPAALDDRYPKSPNEYTISRRDL